LEINQIRQAEQLLQKEMNDSLGELCDQIHSGEKLDDQQLSQIRDQLESVVSELQS
jgi:hypothetical protein